ITNAPQPESPTATVVSSALPSVGPPRGPLPAAPSKSYTKNGLVRPDESRRSVNWSMTFMPVRLTAESGGTVGPASPRPDAPYPTRVNVVPTGRGRSTTGYVATPSGSV